jgi:hypothetical protein
VLGEAGAPALQATLSFKYGQNEFETVLNFAATSPFVFYFILFIY